MQERSQFVTRATHPLSALLKPEAKLTQIVPHDTLNQTPDIFQLPKNLKPHLISLVLLLPALFAQSDRGQITGSIQDPGGALIPNAQILVVNQGTGIKFETKSTETGNFAAPYLSACLYDITVEVQGFKKFVQKGVRVQVAQSTTVNVQLQIGATSEGIDVTGDAPLLQTESGPRHLHRPLDPLRLTSALVGLPQRFLNSKRLIYPAAPDKESVA